MAAVMLSMVAACIFNVRAPIAESCCPSRITTLAAGPCAVSDSTGIAAWAASAVRVLPNCCVYMVASVCCLSGCTLFRFTIKACHRASMSPWELLRMLWSNYRSRTDSTLSMRISAARWGTVQRLVL